MRQVGGGTADVRKDIGAVGSVSLCLMVKCEAGAVSSKAQFLGDTVASTRLQLARDKNGCRILHRIYRFEFTETGNSRREEEVVMLSDRVERVAMVPYQIVE